MSKSIKALAEAALDFRQSAFVKSGSLWLIAVPLQPIRH